MNMKRLAALWAVAGIGFVPSGWAVETFTINDVTNLTNSAAEDLIKTIAVGADHRPYSSASPLGLAIGLEIGVDVTVIPVPSSFTNALQTVGNTANVPSALPLPRLNIRKGLPFGIDLGFSYIGVDDNKIVGGDIQWAFLTKPALPNVAVRASQTLARLGFITTRTTSIDVLASKKVGFLLDPYVGFGVQFASGELAYAAGATLPVGVEAKQSVTHPRLFVGLPIKLVLFKLVAEYGYSFSGVSTYGGKFGFSF